MTEKIIFTQLTADELKELVSDELKKVLQRVHLQQHSTKPKIGGIQMATEITGYTQSTVYTMVSRGQIPHFKRGGRLLFNEETLRSWLTEGQTSSSSDYQQDFQNHMKKLRS